MSISSFGTNDFIDLNTASLDQEEDDDLGSQYNRNSAPFRYSLRSIDEAETERIRRSLVSPSSKYSGLDVPSGTKSPSSQSSYAESIALFRNMDKMGNEPIDLITSQFRDYFDYDLDDLCSSAGSKSPSQAKKQIGLLASRKGGRRTRFTP
ncbi:MAG: hypothetical protein EXX96DRAFT_127662 [Benjaminiella poitrasii]|nr:MAG: hypothetical protein EXX96DRAFT_127662 [Benjaminiella poitrasii]